MPGGCGCGPRKIPSFMDESYKSPLRYSSRMGNSYASETRSEYYEREIRSDRSTVNRLTVRLPTPEEQRMILALDASNDSSNSRYTSYRPQQQSFSTKQYLENVPQPQYSFSPSRNSTMRNDSNIDNQSGSYSRFSMGSSPRRGCGC